MSRSSAVRELSLRDYKFYAKLVPLCFAVSVLRTTTTTDDRQTDRWTDSVLPSQWLLDANSQVLRARARAVRVPLSRCSRGAQFGAGMEFFMVKTGFYDKVTQLEAEKMAGHEAKREAFMELIKTPTREEKRKDDSAGASEPSK